MVPPDPTDKAAHAGNGESSLDEARLESLLRISNHSAQSIPELLDFALEEAVALTGSRLGYVYYYDEETKEFRLNSWSKEVMGACAIADRQRVYQLDRTGIWGEAVRQRRAILVNDFAAPDPLKRGLPEGHAPLTRFLTVPVQSGGRIVAVVGVANKLGPYDQADIRQLNLMMDSVWRVVERKATEEVLRESEEKYRALFTQSTLGIYLHDLDGQNLDVNQVACLQSGFTREELLQRTVFDNLPQTPGILPMSKETILGLWRAWPEGQRHVIESVHVRKDGTSYPVEISTGSIGYGGRKLMLAVVQDITLRKQTEAALRDEKEWLAVTLRSIGDGVITSDIDGRVVMMNPVAEQLTGWRQREAEGRPLAEVFNIVQASSRRPCDNPVTRALAGGHFTEFPEEIRLVARDGVERPIAESGAPIKDAAGRAMGVVLVFRDMTEKQRLLASLQRSSRLESLGVLAGGIAHDFNNLLSGIFGYVDLARLETNEPETAEYLTKALGALTRARGLTGQLLTFAKGGTPVKRVQSLFPFVQETARFALSGSASTCEFDVPNGLWPCDFDRNQIGQVIDNIVINAEQAMPGGGAIKVTARNVVLAEGQHPSLAPGHYAQLSIADHGIGIPQEHLERIFDPFYTTKPKGHGLGLATCYSIVRRHAGCLDVESEPGKGSVFHVYLPAAATSGPRDETEASSEHRGKGTFLVMDDEMIVRETVGEMLRSFGYTPVPKEHGAEAVDFFAAERAAGREIAGMVFDLTIPGGMGGKEAIGAVRSLCARTPVFVASGYAEDPVMASPKEYGFTGSICKPFLRADLARLLNEHMRRPE